MAQIKAKFQFRKSFLAMMIGLGLLPSAHAMQELTDSSLSDTTGEGVALVLDDFKMVFRHRMMLPVVQAMHEVLPIQVRQTLALFVLFRLERTMLS